MGVAEKVKKWIGKVEKEFRVIKGTDTKDKIYYSRKKFKNRQDAERAFIRAKEKLFNVNSWNNIPALAKTTFSVFNNDGKKLNKVKVAVGDYLKIDLPGPTPSNWVIVQEIVEENHVAEFVVRPTHNPTLNDENKDIVVDHFYQAIATSSFRVTLNDNLLSAYEIGRNEGINNRQPEAGDRTIVNTLVSEGGWLFLQKYQWKHLTDYLVGII